MQIIKFFAKQFERNKSAKLSLQNGTNPRFYGRFFLYRQWKNAINKYKFKVVQMRKSAKETAISINCFIALYKIAMNVT